MKAYKTSKIEDYRIWNQPTLTSNGTMGESDFACYANTSYDSTAKDCYQAFSPNTGTVLAYRSLKQSTLYVYFQTKNPLLITKFSFYVPINGTQNNYNGGWAENIYLYGKNAQGDWEQMAYVAGGANMGKAHHIIDLSNNTKAYNSFKFQVSSKGTGHNDEVEISQIKIDGKEKVQTVRNAYLAVTEKQITKVDLDKEPNFIKVGSPTISKGVMSGFSKTNYALVPSVPSNVQSYEMVAKFTTGALDGTQQGVLANSTTNKCTPQIVISTANNLSIDHAQDADTWITGYFMELQANTTYWVKVAWDGSLVTAYYKTTSSADWVQFMSEACTTCYWTEQVGIGIGTTSYPFKGSIDLNECYIKINGQMWWSANREVTICKMVKGD